MTDAGEWVPLGVGGEIRTLTVIGEAFEGFPAPPFAIAFVQLDGADTAILNRLEGRDWSKPGDWHRLIRKRATMVFRGTPLGSWLDFHFVIDDAR
ncbi:MAG: OB-fold domain-containing protein [Rhizobiaceae bacterium]